MIHRAPMTRKEMEREDIEQRQGRSRHQYRTSSIGAAVSGILLLATLLGIFIFKLFES
jgi:hypothetical protein|tara:strand:- start:891 stop:1064 length:174 start_codon:yes stop_codon:yes gene_type:complete